MAILDFFTGILKRLTLTDEELNSIKKGDVVSEKKSTQEVDILVKSLKKYMNMYFDDYYQVRSFQDEEYRKVLDDIRKEIKKNPATIEFQIENLKQFLSFSKSMHKMIIKNIIDSE